MRVIIAGSRHPFSLKTLSMITKAVEESGFEVTEVVSGHASGVYRWGETWASKHKIKCSEFPASWNIHGRSAGHRRNAVMSHYADALIAIWDGRSPGTYNMIRTMRKLEKPVYVMLIEEKTRVTYPN